MEFKGKYMISASPDAVWAALRDPDMLRAAIPDCEAFEKLSETVFMARAAIKVGPVKTSFEGRLQLQNIPPADGAAFALILNGEGQGGSAGFARGESHVQLYADGSGTRLEYDARATIGGRLAQVGHVATDSAAKTFADEFFDRFANLMRGEPAVLEEPHLSKRLPIVPVKKAAKNEEDLAPQLWVAGLIGVITILLIVFSIVL
jgi:carbon monoxide dehydrogenase subunit G